MNKNIEYDINKYKRIKYRNKEAIKVYLSLYNDEYYIGYQCYRSHIGFIIPPKKFKLFIKIFETFISLSKKHGDYRTNISHSMYIHYKELLFNLTYNIEYTMNKYCKLAYTIDMLDEFIANKKNEDIINKVYNKLNKRKR